MVNIEDGCNHGAVKRSKHHCFCARCGVITKEAYQPLFLTITPEERFVLDLPEIAREDFLTLYNSKKEVGGRVSISC